MRVGGREFNSSPIKTQSTGSGRLPEIEPQQPAESLASSSVVAVPGRVSSPQADRHQLLEDQAHLHTAASTPPSRAPPATTPPSTPTRISDTIDIDEPTGHGPTDASMAYTFDFGGHVESYAEIAGGGAQSPVFMCDFGDKQ